MTPIETFEALYPLIEDTVNNVTILLFEDATTQPEWGSTMSDTILDYMYFRNLLEALRRDHSPSFNLSK